MGREIHFILQDEKRFDRVKVIYGFTTDAETIRYLIGVGLKREAKS